MPKFVVLARSGGVYEILELRGSDGAHYYAPVLTAKNYSDAIRYTAKLNKETK